MNFNELLAQTLGFEGGQTTDSGGKTNAGITQSTYDSYAKENKLDTKDVNNLSFGDVKDVYYNNYFKKPKIDQIPGDSVQSVLFDYGVNSGTGTAIKALQKIVGTKSDGLIGKNTIKAVNKYITKNGENSLTEAVLQNRENLFSSLATQNPEKYGQYLGGWMNRTNALRRKYTNP